ncbi:hypothetical protein [Rhodohalobacter sp.]|uniref:hypothetical protein n=1 Tax=Rhodohalobacter sp. TaxID=1974210 RepID=UPI002ACE3429|nr:hypothetical protein [Rhodohalobacter sp.]MDZ7757878.1 hypothetical protein [Rhodohalobacter sp.]
MKSLSIFAKYFILTVFLIFSTSCEEISTDNLEELSIDEVAQLIDQEVGNANAETVSSCRVLAIGAKPCGGPWGYLVYSEEDSDPEKLELLVERYNELDEIRMKENGYGSTCDYATEPTLLLKNGSCHGEGYAWNPGDIIEHHNRNK